MSQEQESVDYEIAFESVHAASEWRYRAEGNANIILSYCPSSSHGDPRLIGRVLRVRKVERDGDGESRAVGVSKKRKSDKSGYQEWKWTTDVMKPLIGPLVANPMAIRVCPEFLSAIAVRVEADRPLKRRCAGRIDVDRKFAFLHVDAATFEAFWAERKLTLHHASAPSLQRRRSAVCVEIKPKWGFLPSSRHISEEGEIKKRLCRSCLSKSSNPSLCNSPFCPLDLFSTDPHRVARGLQMLFQMPTNKLCVFVDGEKCFPSKETEDSSGLEYIVADCVPSSADTTPLEGLIDLVTSVLLRSSVLKRVKTAQMLDSLDIEAIHALYNKYWSHDIDDVIQRMCLKYRRNSEALSCDVSDIDMLTKEEAFHAIVEYLLSTSAKDCSLMVTIQRHEGGVGKALGAASTVYSDIDQMTYLCQVHVVDLDPRLPCNIPYYYQQDQTVVRKAISSLSSHGLSCTP